MNGTAPSADNPRLLLEAARVFNAAGSDYRTVAEVVAELALENIAKADPDVRPQIRGDAAALRLSGRVPGGYQQALELLKGVGDRKEDDPDGRLHLLRAFAFGQMYRKEKPGKFNDDPVLTNLCAEIRKDLKFAFAQDPTKKAANRFIWQPDRAALAGSDREDDLQAVYENDCKFRKLVALPDQAPRPQEAPELDDKSG